MLLEAIGACVRRCPVAIMHSQATQVRRGIEALASASADVRLFHSSKQAIQSWMVTLNEAQKHRAFRLTVSVLIEVHLTAVLLALGTFLSLARALTKADFPKCAVDRPNGERDISLVPEQKFSMRSHQS